MLRIKMDRDSFIRGRPTQEGRIEVLTEGTALSYVREGFAHFVDEKGKKCEEAGARVVKAEANRVDADDDNRADESPPKKKPKR